MKKYRKPFWLLCLPALLLLSACQQTKQEEGKNDPSPPPAQQEEQKETVPTLTALPTAGERAKALQSLSEEGRKAYDDQIYALLDECTAQQVASGLQKELEDWSAQAQGIAFTHVSVEHSQDPLLMWSGGDKRQYRNISLDIRLLYDPASAKGEEKQIMEPLLEEAQQLLRQSPYSLRLVSARLAFVDGNTDYPNYVVEDVSVGLTGEDDPSAPTSPEEQALQTLAYEKVSAFNSQEFSEEPFKSLPYANMTLSRFGAAPGSPVLECEVRIQEAPGEDAQAFAQKLEALAQELADGWMGESAPLEALGLSLARITFALRYSPDSPLVYELPLGGA